MRRLLSALALCFLLIGCGDDPPSPADASERSAYCEGYVMSEDVRADYEATFGPGEAAGFQAMADCLDGTIP